MSKKDEKIIILTVEEAKDLLGWLHNSQWKHHTDLEYAEDWQRDWIRYLKERIEQAEATKICNDYNKALNRVADEFQKQEEIIRLKCEIEQLKAEQEVDNYLKDQFLKVWRTRNEY